MTKEKIERLENENRALTEQIKDLTRKLETANHFSKKENVELVILRATKQGIKIEKLEKEIQKLKSEKINEDIVDNKDNEIQKLKNERNAGRKNKFTANEIEQMKMYRIQKHTYKELSQMFKCSVATIHKLINE